MATKSNMRTRATGKNKKVRKGRGQGNGSAILAHPDAELIICCVQFASTAAGLTAAFMADPTEDCDFANHLDGRTLPHTRKLINVAANYLPSTMDGLRAKAVIMETVIETAGDIAAAAPFLKSLTADIARFHKAATVATDTKIAS